MGNLDSFTALSIDNRELANQQGDTPNNGDTATNFMAIISTHIFPSSTIFEVAFYTETFRPSSSPFVLRHLLM